MEVFLIYGDQAIKFSKFQDLKEIATIIILSILLEAIKFWSSILNWDTAMWCSLVI